MGLLAIPVVLDLSRTIHEAFIPHRVLADRRGLELSWAVTRRFVPWVRRETAAIAWDDLSQIRANTVSVNGVSTTDLTIERRDGSTVRIPHGTFSPDGSVLQERILDELQARRDRPQRDAARVAEFCRLRHGGFQKADDGVPVRALRARVDPEKRKRASDHLPALQNPLETGQGRTRRVPLKESPKRKMAKKWTLFAAQAQGPDRLC